MTVSLYFTQPHGFDFLIVAVLTRLIPVSFRSAVLRKHKEAHLRSTRTSIYKRPSRGNSTSDWEPSGKPERDPLESRDNKKTPWNLWTSVKFWSVNLQILVRGSQRAKSQFARTKRIAIGGPRLNKNQKMHMFLKQKNVRKCFTGQFNIAQLQCFTLHAGGPQRGWPPSDENTITWSISWTGNWTAFMS